jgi:hypothetical protein
MTTYKEWNVHFDKVSVAKSKSYLKAIAELRKDPMIEYNYGNDLGSIAAIINISLYHRK